MENDNMVSVLERTAETYRPLLAPCIVADGAVRIRDVLVMGRRRDEDPRRQVIGKLLDDDGYIWHY